MQEYIGRFAPSPTGKLHIGSLLCAVASFLDAKSMNGKWLVRIEDLDLPRTVDGASDDILYTLEAFNLYWDDCVVYQSQRHHLYQEALDNLRNQNLIYPCFCSRKEIKEQGRVGLDGVVYYGKCRDKSYVKLQKTPSYRIKTNNTKIEFNDLIVGKYSQNLAYDIGDFVLLRSDNQWAYQLAVIVDDSLQKITRIVRGQDLLVSTPRQIYLLECLGFKIPEYAHLPLLLNAQGQKLSKQTLAPALDIKQKIQLLKQVLIYLNLPNDMPDGNCEDLLSWAVEHWDISRVPKEGIKVFQAI